MQTPRSGDEKEDFSDVTTNWPPHDEFNGLLPFTPRRASPGSTEATPPRNGGGHLSSDEERARADDPLSSEEEEETTGPCRFSVCLNPHLSVRGCPRVSGRLPSASSIRRRRAARVGWTTTTSRCVTVAKPSITVAPQVELHQRPGEASREARRLGSPVLNGNITTAASVLASRPPAIGVAPRVSPPVAFTLDAAGVGPALSPS